MKPTTGQKTSSPVTGSIPTKHELLEEIHTKDLEVWIEKQLSDLELQFAEFATNHGTMSGILSAR